MRKFLVFLVFLGVNCANAQVNDGFTDGNFTAAPVWLGDVADYTVNANNQLQSVVNAASKTVNLYTANNNAVNTKWNFYVELAFDPSTSNQVRIYLTADNSDFTAPLNGYYLLIGESGATDSYDLFKQTGTTSVKIIDGAAKTRTNVDKITANIEITRNSTGLWDLKTDNTGGVNYTSEGTVTDNTFITSNFFGVQCKYTATRSNLFYFDNFLVTDLVDDVTPPTLSSLTLVGDNKIELAFNEALGITEASNLNNFSITPGNILPTSISVNGGAVTLNYDTGFNTGNYTLNISNLKDNKGNTLTQPIANEFTYTKPYFVAKNDVLINEILYDPKGDNEDFIELYNNTDKVLDFKDLFIATVSSTTNIVGTPKQISTVSIQFAPQSYWVITPDPNNIKLLYTVQKPNNFVTLSSMPTLVNEAGRVLILDKANKVIDSLSYTDKMHFALLKETEGVSLERSSFTNNTNAVGNFKSAAASVGYATPTYKNSQAVESVEANEEVSLASETFSPDNDGFEDALRILYKFDKPNYIANVTIYNSQGGIVKKLIKNQTLATTGELEWDGLDQTGAMKAKTGIYIVYVELYNLDGDIKKFRKTAVLASKF